jgi:peptidoglycan/LPS O-acetylase OafA/YrhL
MFGMAVVIRPIVRGIPDLEDAWSAILMCGALVGFVGALLWERDARRRRLAAPMLLGVWLIAGGVFARSSGDPWASLGALVSLIGFGVLLLAFVVGRPSSDQDVAKPATGWR